MMWILTSKCRSALALGVVAIGLSACGGGGGGSESAQTPPPPPAPAVSLSAQPGTVEEGRSAQLSWSSTNATQCTASGGWAGILPASGSRSTDALTSATTFHLACSGSAGSTTASTTVAVAPAAPVISVRSTFESRTAGSGSSLEWSAANATSCAAGGGWAGNRGLYGTEAVGPLAATSTFTLSCSGIGGTREASATVTVGPNTPPTAHAGIFQEVRPGSTVMLSAAASADPGGSIATYQWTQSAGNAVVLTNGTSATPTFVAPAASTLQFTLVVNDDGGLPSSPKTATVHVRPPNPGTTSVSGRVTFARVPFAVSPALGLDYLATREEPARGIVMLLIDASTGGQVGRARSTDENGNYLFDDLAPGRAVFVQARAEMREGEGQNLPRWTFVVRSAAEAFNNYFFDGLVFTTGQAGETLTHDLAIQSGWDSSTRQPTGTRHAAPFAILDTIYRAFNKVLEVAPFARFEPLVIVWSPENPARQTFYDPATTRISLSGEADVDMDEYDPHTIAHEFGHYLEDTFARSDSIGGPHAFGDLLDPRVAFSEGFAYAFAAIALDDPVIRDAIGPLQQDEVRFSVEQDNALNEGWFSEASVQEIIWDLFDDTQEPGDPIAMGLSPIWRVIVDAQRTTDALTSIFTFLTPLRLQNVGLAPQIEQIVAAESVRAQEIEFFASTERNTAQRPSVLPLYTPIAIGGGPVTVRSDSTGQEIYNKLANRRFLRLEVPEAQFVRITVAAEPVSRDVDLRVFRRGFWAVSEVFGNENALFPLSRGVHVLEVYDCGNAACSFDDEPAPVDITVNVTAN